jgi:multidrug efflux pump subunit AcrA (membrane-fusion protein)
MIENENSFELRSEEVQEILTRVPNWIIRWGSVVVLLILVLLFLVSCLVKYPDIISSQIVITTNVPPQKLIAKTSGKIEAILIKDRAIVAKNTPLAVIENAANYSDVFLLKSIVDTIKINKSAFPFDKLKSAQLGDVESAYALFQKEYSADELNSKLQPYKVEGTEKD